MPAPSAPLPGHIWAAAVHIWAGEGVLHGALLCHGACQGLLNGG